MSNGSGTAVSDAASLPGMSGAESFFRCCSDGRVWRIIRGSAEADQTCAPSGRVSRRDWLRPGRDLVSITQEPDCRVSLAGGVACLSFGYEERVFEDRSQREAGSCG